MKILSILGKIIIVIAVIFLFIDSFVVVSDGLKTYDLFGFINPEPPMWTSFIPGLSYFLIIIYGFFSVHGIVEIIIFSILFSIGLGLVEIGNKTSFIHNNKKKFIDNSKYPPLSMKERLERKQRVERTARQLIQNLEENVKNKTPVN